MQAACYTRYGSADVVRIKDIPRPEIGENEVLVQVCATSVTTADWRLRASAFPLYAWLPGRLMFGLFAPRNKVLGGDFSGRIVARGKNVTRFNSGDEVYGFARNGAHAQFLGIAEDGAIDDKPAGLDHDEAAAVPFGALSALVFLRDLARIQPRQKVLIHGASGGLGVFAVQLAKHFGAEVTGICSTRNLDLVKSLGADRAIDYTREDFTLGGETYDLIFDTVGKTTFAGCRRVLAPKGLYVPVEFGMREIVQALGTSIMAGKRVIVGISGDHQADLRHISELLNRRRIRPVIDNSYPLEAIADAHRRVESRHKTGSVVVTLAACAGSSRSAARQATTLAETGHPEHQPQNPPDQRASCFR